MNEFKITTETDAAQNAFVQFISNYKETIINYMNTIMGNDGTPVDAGIDVQDGNITLYQLAPDKGFVLGEQPQESMGDLPIQVKRYKDVMEGDRYIMQEQDRLVLHLKTEEGKPDAKLGVFKTLTDAVTEFNSESVKGVIKNYHDKEEAIAKREQKQEAKMKKLGAKAIEASPVTEPNV